MGSVSAVVELLRFIIGEIKAYLEHEKKRKHQAGTDKIKADPAGYFDGYRMPAPADDSQLPDEANSGPDQ